MKPSRVRSPEHLAWVRQRACLVCRTRIGVQAHHLTIGGKKARGLKAGDDMVVPLCADHHASLHHDGNERVWWAMHDIDPLEIARKLWGQSPGNKTR